MLKPWRKSKKYI